MERTPDTTSSPAPPGSGHPVLNQSSPSSKPVPSAATSKNNNNNTTNANDSNENNTQTAASAANSSSNNPRRPRPLTQHQLAVEQNRRERVEYILAKRKNELYDALRIKRENDFSVTRYARLLQCIPTGYDASDEEQQSWAKGGLITKPKEDDYGECASYFLSVIRKADRRLDRWDYQDANGPKRDRKKERMERAKKKQQQNAGDANDGPNGNATTNGAAQDAGGSAARAGGSSRSNRSKAASRSNAKRKADALRETPTGSTPNKKPAPSSRSKSSRARASARSGAGEETPKNNSSRNRGARPSPAQPGDDTLDDIDKELLGEGTGDETDEARRPQRPAPRSSLGRNARAAAAAAAAHDEESILADEDNEPLTSENEGLPTDVEMDEGDGARTRHVSAASSLGGSSPAPDLVGKTKRETEG